MTALTTLPQRVREWIDPSTIGARIRGVRRRLDVLRDQGGDPHGNILIVFYNSEFGAPLDLSMLSGPEGIRFSGNRWRWNRADAVVFHIPTLPSLPALKPPGQIWVAWNKESEINYPQLADPTYMAQFDLEMTYRQQADVWIPYGFDDEGAFGRRLRRSPAPKPPGKLIASFVSSHINQSGRIEYLDELSRHIDLHAYGRIGRNCTLAHDEGRATKLSTIAAYKFTIAFENSIVEDYVTEKFFEPLLSGSVPVYLGAPNVAEFAPGARCYIDAREFAGPKALAEYLHYLDGDDRAYAAYHAWRQKPFQAAFAAKQERWRKQGAAFEALGRIVRARR